VVKESKEKKALYEGYFRKVQTYRNRYIKTIFKAKHALNSSFMRATPESDPHCALRLYKVATKSLRILVATSYYFECADVTLAEQADR
jgi:hypothetical protein